MMTRRFSSLFAPLVFWTGAAFAQWQAVPSPSDRIFSFVQSSAGIFAGSENTGLWRSTNGGASFAIHPTGLYEMSFDIRSFDFKNDTLWAGMDGGGVCRSIDGGVTWSSFNEGFATQSFVVGVKHIGDTLYAAVDFNPGMQPSGVYKTPMQQANWQRCGTAFPEMLFGVSSFAATKSGAMVVGAVLGGINGNIQVSVDGGQTWLNRNINGVQAVITLEADQDTIYAGTTDGIYVTRNNAEKWERLGSQFQGATVDDLLFFDGLFFAAVDGVGVVYSDDRGLTWNTITGNLPMDNDFVSAIFIHDEKIFAGLSAAHGVWRAPLTTVGIEDPDTLPRIAILEQNYPNPFNPSTRISYTLSKAERVTLQVYDVLGREVATIHDNTEKEAGSHSAMFNAENLANGIYFYRLTAGRFSETKKMLLVK